MNSKNCIKREKFVTFAICKVRYHLHYTSEYKDVLHTAYIIWNIVYLNTFLWFFEMDRTKLNILLQKSKQNSLNANLIVWEKIMKNKKTFQLQKPKKLQHLIKMGKKLQETHLKKYNLLIVQDLYQVIKKWYVTAITKKIVMKDISLKLMFSILKKWHNLHNDLLFYVKKWKLKKLKNF